MRPLLGLGEEQSNYHLTQAQVVVICAVNYIKFYINTKYWKFVSEPD